LEQKLKNLGGVLFSQHAISFIDVKLLMGDVWAIPMRRYFLKAMFMKHNSRFRLF
jgi:hypothetical protein